MADQWREINPDLMPVAGYTRVVGVGRTRPGPLQPPDEVGIAIVVTDDSSASVVGLLMHFDVAALVIASIESFAASAGRSEALSAQVDQQRALMREARETKDVDGDR